MPSNTFPQFRCASIYRSLLLALFSAVAVGCELATDDAPADLSSGPDAVSSLRYAGDVPEAGERTADFAVGTRRIEIVGAAGRVLSVQFWYFAVDTAVEEAQAGHSFRGVRSRGTTS